MNEEYEYSFKVKSISDFIQYCQENHYKVVEEYKQVRTLYKNGGHVMARITTNTYEDKKVSILNFKDDNLSSNPLKISRESEDLVITKENKKFVDSLIQILDLTNIKKFKRKRIVLKKKNVIFEIDQYTSPKMNVVAIEGKKEEVDQVYASIKNIILKNKIDE